MAIKWMELVGSSVFLILVACESGFEASNHSNINHYTNTGAGENKPLAIPEDRNGLNPPGNGIWGQAHPETESLEPHMIVRDLCGADENAGICDRNGNTGIAPNHQSAAVVATDHPQIAVDSNDTGQALAVWAEPYDDDGNGVFEFDLWSNRYTAQTGWEGAELIETNFAASPPLMALTLDHIGNALILWKVVEGTTQRVWSKRFTVSGGWGVATCIGESMYRGARTPDVMAK